MEIRQSRSSPSSDCTPALSPSAVGVARQRLRLGSARSPRLKGSGSGAPSPTSRVGRRRDAASRARAAATVERPTPPCRFHTAMARQPTAATGRAGRSKEECPPLVAVMVVGLGAGSSSAQTRPVRVEKSTSPCITCATQGSASRSATAVWSTPTGSSTRETPS